MTAQPTPSSELFEKQLTYAGRGRAEFHDPAGSVEGPISIRFNERGETTAEMTVENVETKEPLQLGLMELFSGSRAIRNGNTISVGIGSRQNVCTKLSAQCDQGEFIATDGLHYGFGIHLGDEDANPTTLTFHPPRARVKFSTNRTKYWVVPLSNFISSFSTYLPEVEHHRLRVRSSTEEGSADRPDGPVIAFEFDCKLGFIQPLADYEQLVSNLEEGRERQCVTALLVGEVPSSTEEWENWFPFDFFRLMSFATGSTVGAPWIEFRDENGAVVDRFHRSFELSPFTEGCRIFEEGLHSGLGYLLTRYLCCRDRGAPFLNVALKHINQAAAYAGSVEDMTIYLCRAFEGLCDHYGFKRQHLLNDLGNSQRQEVKDQLDEATRQIRSAARRARKAGLSNDAQIIERIADRAANAANQDVNFGLAVTKLLEHFGLPDASIIDAHYQNNPRGDNIPHWSGVLSHYRGTTVHRSHYNFLAGHHDIDDVIRINDHLLDILIRIVFKIVGYDGTYQPAVIKATDRVRADWVNSSVTAASLGY